MSEINNENIEANNALKKLLSIRGIFIIYSPKIFLKTLPFIVSLTVLVLYSIISICSTLNQTEVLKYLVDKFLNIFPNLLGFSLGGYAIIVGFGNTNFLQRIARSTENGEHSVYEKLNSIFAFNLLCQIFVLAFSLTVDFSFFIVVKLKLFVSAPLTEFINCVAASTLIFMATWTLLVIPYLVSNIFIFGEVHHYTLQNTPPPSSPEDDRQ